MVSEGSQIIKECKKAGNRSKLEKSNELSRENKFEIKIN